MWMIVVDSTRSTWCR